MRWPSGVALVLQGTAKRYHTPLAAKIHPRLKTVKGGEGGLLGENRRRSDVAGEGKAGRMAGATGRAGLKRARR